ncbi:MAG: hypothetical protein PHT53_03685, partial [Candidatus Omnitrophica bacterium]|nr:hypothetical protein [Candidatus Omnitrophota bacterium]
EPFFWKDGEYNLDDIIEFSEKLGFFRVVVCTNGTFPLQSKASYLWVSLDGQPAQHNTIRGRIYDDVLNNLNNSNHRGIYVNFTVSAVNAWNFEQAAAQIFDIKNVRGIFFHLFTPYLGSNKAMILDEKTKRSVIDKLIRIKRRHPFRVVNTFDGLKYLKRDKWRRPVWSSITINQGQLGLCCCRKGIYDETVCKECGCSPAVESFVLQEAKPAAIIENLRFL